MVETNQWHSGKQEFSAKYQIKQTTFKCKNDKGIIIKEL